MSEHFKNGDWLLYDNGKDDGFGYIIEEVGDDRSSMKVHMIDKNLNNFNPGNGELMYRFIEPNSPYILKFNEPDVDYDDDIENVLQPIVVDHLLKTRQFETLKGMKKLKKKPLES